MDNLDVVFELGIAETAGLSVILIFLGKFLTQHVGFLSKYLIPFPVVGGFVMALITILGYVTGTFGFEFDNVLQSYFMILFFTTVGFTASIKVIKAGGKALVLLFLCAIVLILAQNALGIGLSALLGENLHLGLAIGSISMAGGHGTSAAFGPLLEETYGLQGATTAAMAAATFGLVLGSVIAGPIARKLIVKYKLAPGDQDDATDKEAEKELKREELVPAFISIAFFQVVLAAGIGYYVSLGINALGITLPAYIGSMIVAAFMRNLLKDGTKVEIKLPEVEALGGAFIAIFLTQAIMKLKLWELLDLALPLFIILICQVILGGLFARFLVFNVMGRDYDAAVMAAGACGMALGATPNAMANMNAVCSKYGYSAKAFFVLPIVGAFLIDIANGLLITMFANIVA